MAHTKKTYNFMNEIKFAELMASWLQAAKLQNMLATRCHEVDLALD